MKRTEMRQESSLFCKSCMSGDQRERMCTSVLCVEIRCHPVTVMSQCLWLWSQVNQGNEVHRSLLGFHTAPECPVRTFPRDTLQSSRSMNWVCEWDSRMRRAVRSFVEAWLVVWFIVMSVVNGLVPIAYLPSGSKLTMSHGSVPGHADERRHWATLFWATGGCRFHKASIVCKLKCSVVQHSTIHEIETNVEKPLRVLEK